MCAPRILKNRASAGVGKCDDLVHRIGAEQGQIEDGAFELRLDAYLGVPTGGGLQRKVETGAHRFVGQFIKGRRLEAAPQSAVQIDPFGHAPHHTRSRRGGAIGNCATVIAIAGDDVVVA